MNIGRLHRTVNNFSRGEWEFNPAHFETFQCSMSFLYPDEQEHFVVCSPSAASRWLVGRRRDCKPWATTFDEHPLTSIFLKYHSCNKRPWQSKLGQQGHNKKKRKDTSMSAERIISNTSAALAENNVSGELKGEKDPYLHYSFPSAPSYITSQKWTECTIIHGIKMSSYMYDVYRMTPLASG